ncbi:MAG: hypothetical protein NT133_06960 [Alphaproteobacteria bacterium]|nr:hypothetical protein [Alphaproteobacteria bacterium]
MIATDLDPIWFAVRFARALELVETVPGALGRFVAASIKDDGTRAGEEWARACSQEIYDSRAAAVRAAMRARKVLGGRMNAVIQSIEDLGGIDAIEARAAIIADGGADIVPFPPGGGGDDGSAAG